MADAKISALPGASTPLAGTEVVPLVQSGATKKVAVSDLTAGRNVSLAQLTATATTQKLADNTSADLTVQIGPDTPTAGRSSRIALISSSTQKNWYITNSWNTTGALSLVQTTAAGGLAMSGTDSHQFLDNGDYKIVNGNLIQGTAAKGVNFTANTPAAGMTSQLLNAYEEGTWTVALYDAASGGNASSTTTTGYYTRIGRVVHCYFGDLSNINTTGMTAGNALYISLPFSVSSTCKSCGSVTLEKFTFPSGSSQINPFTIDNGSRVVLRSTGSGIDNDSVKVSDITSGTSDITRFFITIEV